MQRMRHEYKKAIRRMHHPTPDGFAKPLRGENLESSTPALRFGGKTASPRLFRGYAQFGLPYFWAFVFAGRSHDAPSQRRDGRPPRGQRGFGAAGFFGLLSNLGIDRRNFRNPD